MEQKELTFEWKGTTFRIRGRATRGDQYEMHAAMAAETEVQNGKIIRASPSKLYPWLIQRFVTGWSADDTFTLQKLMDQPAEPGEDLVLILGSYILNHTGMAYTSAEAERKNA